MYQAVLFTDNTHENEVFIGLGPYKVASVLRKHNYETLVVNHLSFFEFDEIKKLLDKTISSSTVVVGFSTTFMQLVETDDNNRTQYFPMIGTDTVFPQGKVFEDLVISYIKGINPNIKIMVGGVKVDPSTKNENLDYAFLGYSETSVVNLMDHLTKDVLLPNSTVNEYGVTIIDDRTAPKYHFTEDMMIWEDTDVVNYKVLPIEISRGCIFQCKFCSYPLNGKKAVDYNKNNELLYRELLDAYERFGITHFTIVDDTFNDHIDKLTNLEAVIKRLPFQPYFWCYARLDLICTNPKMIDLMYSIGIRVVLFGIETLNQNTGRIVGKGYDRTKQINMIKYIRDTYPDMLMIGNFIIGLPHEPLSSIEETMTQLVSGETFLHSYTIKELWLFEKSFSAFNSDLNLNYYKYGYEIINNHRGVLIWQNEYLDFHKARELADRCMNLGMQGDHFYMNGVQSIHYVNLGYDLLETNNTLTKNFNYDLIPGKVESFVKDYKQKLYNLLDIK